MSIHVTIVNEQNYLRLQRKRIESLITYTLKKEGLKKARVTLLVCDDKKIKKYHKDYLKKNTATDVISFGVPESGLPLEKNYIGDVVASAQTAKRVCAKYETTAHKELERYLVHGVLHLLGYDDHKPKDYKLMHKTQENYLETFNEIIKKKTRKVLR